MSTVTHPALRKLVQRAPFQGGETPVVVAGKGEGGARMALQATTLWVEVHYGDLQTLTLFTVRQKTILKNRDPFFMTLIHFISHEE